LAAPPVGDGVDVSLVGQRHVKLDPQAGNLEKTGLYLDLEQTTAPSPEF
jgi:hypothetical protein